MASGNVPDFDGAVVAAASDQFAVRRKSNGVDTVIETSEHMKHTGTSKDNQKKNLLFRVPGQRRLANCTFWSVLHFYISSTYLSKKTTIFGWPVSWTLPGTNF